MGVMKLSPVHERIIDWMVANPGAKIAEIAKEFGYSQSFIGQLVSSDLFRTRLNERYALVSAANALEVKDKLHKLATESLDRLLLKVRVEERTDQIREVAELALKGVGVIASRPGPVPQVIDQSQQIHLHQVDKNLLEQARNAMLGLKAPSLNVSQLPEG